MDETSENARNWLSSTIGKARFDDIVSQVEQEGGVPDQLLAQLGLPNTISSRVRVLAGLNEHRPFKKRFRNWLQHNALAESLGELLPTGVIDEESIFFNCRGLEYLPPNEGARKRPIFHCGANEVIGGLWTFGSLALLWVKETGLLGRIKRDENGRECVRWVCVDLQDGREIWRHQLPGRILGVCGDVILMLDAHDSESFFLSQLKGYWYTEVKAFDLRDGAPRAWGEGLARFLYEAMVVHSYVIGVALSEPDGAWPWIARVFRGEAEPKPRLYCLNGVDGTILWTHELSGRGFGFSSVSYPFTDEEEICLKRNPDFGPQTLRLTWDGEVLED